jgi:5-formyltetrahydrofolate cyclo-ligase
MAGLQLTVKAQKQTLRKAITASLHKLTSAEIDQQSQAITSRLLALSTFQTSNVISCYLSMPSAEARTSTIVDTILQSGKSLFVPKIQTKEGKMDFLRIYSSTDLASVPRGIWGIREPDDDWENGKRAKILQTMDAKQEKLDMIILPGVAFDRVLHRLGHGKGYYDSFIASYVASERPKPLLVAICLREQLLPQDQIVPHTSHDWDVDILVTPDEIITRSVLPSINPH